MPLSDEQVLARLRELVLASYTSARPRGMRTVRGDDLLVLAQRRFGRAITLGDVDEAIVKIGGEPVALTSFRQLSASVVARRGRWLRAYVVPSAIFEGLEIPTRFRAPRSRPAR